MGQDIVDHLEPPVGPQLLQHTLPVLMAQRDVLGDEVGQMPRVAAVQHRRDKVVAELRHQLLIRAEQGVGAPQHGLHPGCDLAGEFLLQYLHIGLQKGLSLPQPQQPGALLALHENPDAAVRGLDDL